LFPIVADIIMQDLKEIAIRLSVWLLFYFRYVYDIISAVLSESINDILKIFNSLHIRFTMEIGIDDRLSILDTWLKNRALFLMNIAR